MQEQDAGRRLARRLGLLGAIQLAIVTSLTLAACDSGGSATSPDVGSIVINPASVTVGVGRVVPMEAQVRDAAGALLPIRSVFWTTEDSAIAQISSGGLVTGRTPGTTHVAASAGGRSAVATVHVTPKTVVSITVTPGTLSLVVGQSSSLTATALDADGAELADRHFSWSTSDSAVASVDPSGVVNARTPGATNIAVTSEGRTATVPVSVSAVPVARVVVTPASDTLLVGATQQLTASARDGGDAVLANRLIVWSSANDTIASVSSTGLVSARAAGSVLITAASEGRSADATIVVLQQPVATVTLSPPQSSLSVGQTLALVVRLADASGTALTGRAVSFSSSAPSVATVSASGVVAGVSAGTATITATSEGRSDTSAITVSAIPVATISLAPPMLSLVVGESGQLTATLRSAAGDTLTGRAVSWTSGAPSVATVDQNGLVSAVAAGSALIFAASAGVTTSATVNVNVVPVGSVSLSSTTVALRTGQSATLTATVRDTSGAIVTNRTVDWSSSDTRIATVSSAGVVTAIAAGTATVTASSGGARATAAITVTTPAPTVASVTVTPPTLQLAAGQSGTITAAALDASGTAIPGVVIAWTSSDSLVATVNGGSVTAIAPGVATITATANARSATSTVVVSLPSVAAIVIAPRGGTIQSNGSAAQRSIQLMATALDAAGKPINGVTITWQSSDTTVMTVSSSGVVTALHSGTATITASAGGRSDSVSVVAQ